MKIFLPAAILLIVLTACGHNGWQKKEEPPACDVRNVEDLRRTYSAKNTTLKNRLADKMSTRNVDPAPAMVLLQDLKSVKAQIDVSYAKTENACRALANCAAAFKKDLTRCGREQSEWQTNNSRFSSFAGPLNQLDSQVRLLRLPVVEPKEAAKKTGTANREKECKPVVGTIFTECK